MCDAGHVIDIHVNPTFSLYFQIKENDRVVLETLMSIFNPMLEELPEPDDSDWCYTQTLFCVGAIHQHAYQSI